jgi:hypothetical protein
VARSPPALAHQRLRKRLLTRIVDVNEAPEKLTGLARGTIRATSLNGGAKIGGPVKNKFRVAGPAASPTWYALSSSVALPVQAKSTAPMPILIWLPGPR